MRMTLKLANQLMDSLVCLAISANGGADYDHLPTDEQMALVTKYASNKLLEICAEWEVLKGEEWEIEEPEEEVDEEPTLDLDMGFDPYMGCYTDDC